MDTLTKEVAVPLGTYMKGFPSVQRLHPFEQAMLELTWGTKTYEKVLTKVDSLRKSVLEARCVFCLCDLKRRPRCLHYQDGQSGYDAYCTRLALKLFFTTCFMRVETSPGLAEQVLLATSDINTGHVWGRGARVGTSGHRPSHCAHSVVSVSRVEHAPHCIKLIHGTSCRAAYGCQDFIKAFQGAEL